MRYCMLFVLAAAGFLVAGEAHAQARAGYRSGGAAVGPGGGTAVTHKSGGVAAGPFGAAAGQKQSGLTSPTPRKLKAW